MAETEDPNIATLRVIVENFDHPEGRRKGAAALSALASTLAERDRRIAELTGLLIQTNDLAEVAKDRIVAALEAPPAPAPGELEEARADSLLKYPEQAELWEAINDYAEACGANGKRAYSIRRQNAVAEVESIVRAALSRARGEGT